VSVRLPDGSVSLSARDCGLLVFAEAEIVARWRRDGIDPPDLAGVLSMMRGVASEARLARPAHRGVAVVSRVAVVGFVAGVSGVLTVKEAAERLHISEQAVRKAIREGRLSGSRVGRGAWEVGAGSVDEYPARCSDHALRGDLMGDESMTEAELEAFKADALDLLIRVGHLEADVRGLAEAS
jgi:excisionase family DNA binding protein